jgi:hypothetical protein
VSKGGGDESSVERRIQANISQKPRKVRISKDMGKVRTSNYSLK